MYQESDKKNIKVERELDRLKRMLRKGETKKTDGGATPVPALHVCISIHHECASLFMGLF